MVTDNPQVPLFVVRTMQEEYIDYARKLCICFFVHSEKPYNFKKSDKMGNKNSLPKGVVRAMMSLNHETKTIFFVG